MAKQLNFLSFITQPMWLKDFSVLFKFFSILDEKQCPKENNSSFLYLSASLDTQDRLRGPMIVGQKKTWPDLPECVGGSLNTNYTFFMGNIHLRMKFSFVFS